MSVPVDRLAGLGPVERKTIAAAINQASGLTRLGSVFYVDPGSGADTNSGDSKDYALASLDAAVNLCEAGRGDVIIRMRGTETVTSAINFDVSGVTVIAEQSGIGPAGEGEFFATLADASYTDGPVAIITAPTTLIGLGFVSRDTGATFFSGAALLIGGDGDANPFGAYVKDCRFPKWAVDNRIGIAIEGSSDVTIEGCTFEGVGTDFDSGIYVQGATQNLVVRWNHFRDCTYAITHGAFAGGGPHAMYYENVCEDSKLLDAGGNAATGLIAGNYLETATDTASYDDTVTNENALGLHFSGNHYAEGE
jgi:hypothetical protein